MRAKITNNSASPQGVHTPLGVKFVKPGQTRTLEIQEGYEERLLVLPFLTVDVHIEGVEVTDAPLAGTGEAIQLPTFDSNGEPVPPIQALSGDIAETYDAELLEAATDEELAQMHQDKFGKPPHHAAKRETIIAKLVAPADDEA